MALPHKIRSTASALLGVAVLSLSACIDPQVGVRRTGSAPSVSVPRTVSNVSAENQHIVRKGDTLYAIAFRYELDYRDIARWNGISEPFIIKPDQRLTLRDPNSVQGIAQSNAASNSGAPPTQTSVVTTSAVPAQVGVEAPMTQGVSVGSTVPESQLSTVEPLSPTNSEGLPTGFAGNSAAPARPSTPTAANAANTPSAGGLASAPATATAPPVSTSGQADVPTTPPAELMAPKPDTAMAIQTPTLSTGKPSGVKPPVGPNGWGWPVIGRVLTTFSGTDPGRQGVDISGNLGDPVHAAKGGDVVYSGRGIIGYGELIVIKHDDSTLTAYGHNDKRAVKEGQRVTQGQKIAEMGKAPNGQSLLHFEVRRNGKPIDPLSVLPARR